MNTITTKANFSNGMKSLETILNKIEELALNTEFIKICADACEKNGISAKEWNQNKMPIVMKFAADAILGK